MENLELLHERKKSADKSWDEIFAKIQAGEAVPRESIVAAMDRCNKIDQEISKKYLESKLKSRKSELVDCDCSSGDDDQDAEHQKLREQYQEIYGKDVKHG